MNEDMGSADTRRTPHLAAAIVGNGSLLATLSARGEVERLFWPNVDHGQHLGELRLGIAVDGCTRWLDEEPFAHEQAYADASTILRTTARCDGLEVELTDLADPTEPVLARRVRCAAEGAKLVVYCAPQLDDGRFHTAAYVDPDSGAIVFYRRGTALAIAATPVGEAAVGRTRRGEMHSVFEDCLDGELEPGSVAHRAPVEGALVVPLDGEAVVVAAFGSTPVEALAALDPPATAGFAALEGRRRVFDAVRLGAAEPARPGPAGLDRLYRRSLLTLDLLADRETGGVIAAPEQDPQFVESGGYGFVWPRDLAYVTLAFLAARRRDLAEGALRWLAQTQAPEGLWLQRHWTDGSLAPSWSLNQVDQTGAVLFAYEAAWQELADNRLDRALWPSARRAADFLCTFVDPATGLPRPSVDLWEQHEGEHTYSAAAVCGGLLAAAAMAERHEPGRAPRYRAVAERMRAGIERHLWSERHGRYLRSRAVGRRDPHGEPLPESFATALPYPNRVVRSIDSADARVDVSLLGLAWPFGVVDPASPRMRATVAAVERELLVDDGGVLRYAGDTYAGGNPWILASLWLGLYYRQVGDEGGFERCLRYALARQTPVGLLPEQASRDGRPAWVVPLGWSHAMLLLAARPELAIVTGVPHEGYPAHEVLTGF